MISAGSRTQLVIAYVAVKVKQRPSLLAMFCNGWREPSVSFWQVIREHLNSTLPIEVYFDGSSEADLEIFSKLQVGDALALGAWFPSLSLVHTMQERQGSGRQLCAGHTWCLSTRCFPPQSARVPLSLA